jgi:hypothetical protein
MKYSSKFKKKSGRKYEIINFEIILICLGFLGLGWISMGWVGFVVGGWMEA